MGQQTSTDTFETVLGRGRSRLSAAKEEYSAIEGTDSVPDRVVEALVDLEQELDELDQTLEVTKEDIELAKETVQRISILSEILSILARRQRAVIEANVNRLDYHLSGIVELVQEHNLEQDVEPNVADLERRLSMLQTLVDSGRHKQVESNDRVSPSNLDVSIRQLDGWLETRVPNSARAAQYLDIGMKLLDDIHDSLSDLGEQNDERTAYATDLRSIKHKRADVEELLESGSEDRAANTARVALEGCLELHLLTARARAEQLVAIELASTVEEYNLRVDIGQCVERGDAETLLAEVTNAIESQVEQSTGQRLRQLLLEHDGSVVRTAAATDFDIPTIMDHLAQLHADGQLADVTVEFDR
jgi:hypothetical protein